MASKIKKEDLRLKTSRCFSSLKKTADLKRPAPSGLLHVWNTVRKYDPVPDRSYAVPMTNKKI